MFIRSSWAFHRRVLPIAGVVLALQGCTDELPSGAQSVDEPGGAVAFGPPERIASLRAIERSVLFAEVTLRYGTEDSLVEETVVAEPGRGGEVWAVDLRVPGGSSYSLEVVWYDTLDGRRVDLVRTTRSFDAGFDSGAMNLDFSDYDFDGYDDDEDGVTNLAEREAGASPVDEGPGGCPILPEAQSNMSGEPEGQYQNPVNLTDSFDIELPLFSLRTFRLSEAEDGVTPSGGGANFRVSGNDDDSSGIVITAIDDGSDSMSARVRFSSQSSAVDSGTSDDSRISLRGVFFSTIDNGATSASGDERRAGDAQIDIRLRNYMPGGDRSRVLLCAAVRSADGTMSDFVPGTEDGDGDGCAGANQYSLDFETDVDHLIGIGVDRDNKTVSFTIDDRTVELPFDADVFPASEPERAFRVETSGEGVRTVVDLLELSTAESGPLPLQGIGYFDSYGLAGNRDSLAFQTETLGVENGRLKMSVSGENSNESRFTGLRVKGVSDYVEADLTLSSESVLLESGSTASVRVNGPRYNDTRNGGFDGNQGDNRSTLEIGINEGGRVFGNACLIRFQDPTSDACEVFDSPVSFCKPFSSSLDLDIPYRVSISLDRDERRLTYTLGEEQIFHEVTTNLFLPADGSPRIDTRMRGLGTVVGFADNLRTDASPQTLSRQ